MPLPRLRLAQYSRPMKSAVSMRKAEYPAAGYGASSLLLAGIKQEEVQWKKEFRRQ